MRLAIVVEGRTEEEFVKELLRSELQVQGIEAIPVLLKGNVSIDRVVSNMSRLAWNFDSVTSLVDCYGFKGRNDRSPEVIQSIIDAEVGERIKRTYDQSRVFSYVQKYEFEALLFSNTGVLDRLYGGTRQYGIELERVRSKFHSPEDINDDPRTTPSRRLCRIISEYNKVVDGPLIAMETGLTTMRSECARFDEWISRLEALGHSD